MFRHFRPSCEAPLTASYKYEQQAQFLIAWLRLSRCLSLYAGGQRERKQVGRQQSQKFKHVLFAWGFFSAWFARPADPQRITAEISRLGVDRRLLRKRKCTRVYVLTGLVV